MKGKDRGAQANSLSQNKSSGISRGNHKSRPLDNQRPHGFQESFSISDDGKAAPSQMFKKPMGFVKKTRT